MLLCSSCDRMSNQSGRKVAQAWLHLLTDPTHCFLRRSSGRRSVATDQLGLQVSATILGQGHSFLACQKMIKVIFLWRKINFPQTCRLVFQVSTISAEVTYKERHELGKIGGSEELYFSQVVLAGIISNKSQEVSVCEPGFLDET